MTTLIQTAVGAVSPPLDPNWADVQLLLNFDTSPFLAADITSGFTDLSSFNRYVSRVQTGGITAGNGLNVNTDTGLFKFGYASFSILTGSPTPPTNAYAGIFLASNNGTTGLGFTASQNFTVEAWVYITSAGIDRTICGNTGSGSGLIANQGGAVGWELAIIGPASIIQFSCPTFTFNSTFGLTLNTWHHIAVTRSGTSTITIWIDGASAGTLTSAIALPIAAPGTNVFGIGGRGVLTSTFTGSRGFVSGRLDSLRITSNVARYTSAFTPPTFQFPANPRQGLLYHMDSTLASSATSTGSIVASLINQSASFDTVIKEFGTASLSFSGASQSVSLGALGSSLICGFDPFAGNGTLEFWVYFPTAIPAGVGANTSPHILQWGSSANSRSNIWVSGGVIQAFGINTGFVVNSNLSAWHHIAVVRYGNTLTAYINGTSRGTQVPPSAGGPNNFVLGWQFYGGSSVQYLVGKIDELSILINQAKYTQDFIPPTAPMTSI